MPGWQLAIVYALCAVGLVVALWLLRLAWRVASGSLRQGDAVEAAVREEWTGLVERAPLRLARRLDLPGSSHRAYEGTLDGCRVSLQLMSGDKKGLAVTRTDVVVVPPAPVAGSIRLRGALERGRDPDGLELEDVFTVSGGDLQEVRSRLGPAAMRLVVFLCRRGGTLHVDGEALRWSTPDLAFGGKGEALVRELTTLATDACGRLAGAGAAAAGSRQPGDAGPPPGDAE